MRHTLRDGLLDGQRRGAVTVEQAQQGGGDGAKVVASLGGALEQPCRCRRGMQQPVDGAMGV
jgi:hypothetical protein